MHFSIAKEFSDVPWGRVPEDGDFCGENFREKLLVPALKDHEEDVVVDLDGVEGLGSSFLDEAFGGLVRQGHFTLGQLKSHLKIETTQPEYEMYVKLAWKYIEDASRENGKRKLATA